jgi:hypothetical protein
MLGRFSVARNGTFVAYFRVVDDDDDDDAQL